MARPATSTSPTTAAPSPASAAADRLEIRYVPLDTVALWDRNPKLHDEDKLIASIEQYGFRDPPGFDGTLGALVEGNGRTTVLRRMRAEGKSAPRGIATDAEGGWLVPVLFGIDADSRLAAESYAVDHNNLTLAGGTLGALDVASIWSPADYIRLVDQLTQDGMPPVSVDASDLDELLKSLQPKEEVAESEPEGGYAPELADEYREKWGVRVGQTWQLGPHRLVVGDALDTASYEALLEQSFSFASVRVDCLWTDPPYGVEYVGKTAAALTMRSDRASGQEEFLTAAFKRVFTVLKEGSPFYVCLPQGKNALLFAAVLGEVGFELRQTLVWAKDQMVLGHSDYHYKHELILYGNKALDAGRFGRGGIGWYGDNAQTSVIEVKRPKASREHPTMKPPELVAETLKNSTTRGQVVLDPFSGSGSTMIGAHQLGRYARCIEIDPRYAAVNIERMHLLGIEPAILADVSDGRET